MATLREALFREMSRQNKLGAILVMLTCPCHAVMSRSSPGTAVGTWPAAVRAYLYLAFTLVFLFGLWLMVRRTMAPCTDEVCRTDF
jgi:hypothetical protein